MHVLHCVSRQMSAEPDWQWLRRGVEREGTHWNRVEDTRTVRYVGNHNVTNQSETFVRHVEQIGIAMLTLKPSG